MGSNLNYSEKARGIGASLARMAAASQVFTEIVAAGGPLRALETIAELGRPILVATRLIGSLGERPSGDTADGR